MARTPDSYPVVFHSVLRAGGGVLLPETLPWTLRSTRNRFYGFLGALRATPGHPLHAAAWLSWSAKQNGQALVIARGRPGTYRALGDDAGKVLKKLLDEGAGTP